MQTELTNKIKDAQMIAEQAEMGIAIRVWSSFNADQLF
jgi:hypothetical protein